MCQAYNATVLFHLEMTRPPTISITVFLCLVDRSPCPLIRGSRLGSSRACPSCSFSFPPSSPPFCLPNQQHDRLFSLTTSVHICDPRSQGYESPDRFLQISRVPANMQTLARYCSSLIFKSRANNPIVWIIGPWSPRPIRALGLLKPY